MFLTSLLGVFLVPRLFAAVPENLVVEGIPEPPTELKREAGRYLEYRAAEFLGWHPTRREVLISTRFADTAQLHLVSQPLGMRRQLTFTLEPVGGGTFQPRQARCIVYSQDTGGGEFFQLYRYDTEGTNSGRTTLLTDGKSRNTGVRWTRSGSQIAFSSTRRNGKDTDLWVMDPFHPEAARMVYQANGGGWGVSDWSEDETRLVIGEYLSINESALYLLDLKSGKREPITPGETNKVSYAEARFSRDGRSVYCLSDRGTEFRQLNRIDLGTREITPLTRHLSWDVEFYELSPDGKTIALVSNEDTASALRFLDANGRPKYRQPPLPLGVIAGIEWREDGSELGLSLTHANSPPDVYSVDPRTGKLTRWTESETGGLDPAQFATPKVIRTKSFDGLSISALVYHPPADRFPGRRPVIINIHGGPESQSRPIFQGRNNYLIQEEGIAIIYPNVRGSSGYGKTFLTLDNGPLREDSVKDIGAILDWIRQKPDLDPDRVAVTGGSYGGYMTLASLTHYSDRLKCGVDVVGISSFVTFLTNTQDYRKDLRRAEYGDERDPEMRKVLERISPMTSIKNITVPLMVVQGKNDPRVPVTEAEQLVKAMRNNGQSCWYLMAKDEGHGFRKKKNVDYQFFSTILFWRQHLSSTQVQ